LKNLVFQFREMSPGMYQVEVGLKKLSILGMQPISLDLSHLLAKKEKNEEQMVIQLGEQLPQVVLNVNFTIWLLNKHFVHKKD